MKTELKQYTIADVCNGFVYNTYEGRGLYWLAVVKVERDSCGGCHSKIPAQKQLDIRQRKKIIVCEFCGRILVDPDMEQEMAKKKK